MAFLTTKTPPNLGGERYANIIAPKLAAFGVVFDRTLCMEAPASLPLLNSDRVA
jgi:hypothetical protein